MSCRHSDALTWQHRSGNRHSGTCFEIIPHRTDARLHRFAISPWQSPCFAFRSCHAVSLHSTGLPRRNLLNKKAPAFLFKRWRLVAHDLHFQTPFICKYYSQGRLLMKVSKVHFGVYLHSGWKYIIIRRRKSRGRFPLFLYFLKERTFKFDKHI